MSTPEKSATPRTDEQEFREAGNYDVDWAEFARELERENAELREDAARMDWLEMSNGSLRFVSGFPSVGHEGNYGPDPGQAPFWCAHGNCTQAAAGDTIRAAIDAARKAAT